MDSQHLFTSNANDVIPILCGKSPFFTSTTSFQSLTPRPTGTFTSIYLYILQFSTLTREISIQSRIAAHGAHQYLALSPGRDTLYATSWAWPPSLYSFNVAAAPGREDGRGPVVELTYQGKTPISTFLPDQCLMH